MFYACCSYIHITVLCGVLFAEDFIHRLVLLVGTGTWFRIGVDSEIFAWDKGQSSLICNFLKMALPYVNVFRAFTQCVLSLLF